MRKLTIAALVAGQIGLAAGPARAADLVESEPPRVGAFGGVNIVLPLDGARRAQRSLRAGLTLAPTVMSHRANGAVRTFIGPGLELGIGADRRVALSLAGTRLDRLGAAQSGGEEQAEEDGGGPSTLGWIGIGVGATVVVLAGAYTWFALEIADCDPGEDCS